MKRLDRPVDEFQISPLRIRRPIMKVLFVVAVFLVSTLIAAPISGWDVPGAAFVGATIGFAAWVPIVRCLRGRDEPFLPPRPWWRATYRPTASILLAALFAWSFVVGVVQAVGIAPSSLATVEDSAYVAFTTLLTLVQAAYFTVSAVMLLRRRGAQPPL